MDTNDKLRELIRSPLSTAITEESMKNTKRLAGRVDICTGGRPKTAEEVARDLLMEAVVLLDNGNGVSDDARYSFVERAGAALRSRGQADDA